jgi:hypothetical protein
MYAVARTIAITILVNTPLSAQDRWRSSASLFYGDLGEGGALGVLVESRLAPLGQLGPFRFSFGVGAFAGSGEISAIPDASRTHFGVGGRVHVIPTNPEARTTFEYHIDIGNNWLHTSGVTFSPDEDRPDNGTRDALYTGHGVSVAHALSRRLAVKASVDMVKHGLLLPSERITRFAIGLALR